MVPTPPRSTLTDTLCPYTTLCLSLVGTVVHRRQPLPAARSPQRPAVRALGDRVARLRLRRAAVHVADDLALRGNGACHRARPDRRQIGRAHVCTPVTNAPLVSRLLLEQKTTPKHTPSTHTEY